MAVAKRHGCRFDGSLYIYHDEALCVNFHQLRLMEDILLKTVPTKGLSLLTLMKAGSLHLNLRALIQNWYGRCYKDHTHKSGCGMTKGYIDLTSNDRSDYSCQSLNRLAASLNPSLFARIDRLGDHPVERRPKDRIAKTKYKHSSDNKRIE